MIFSDKSYQQEALMTTIKSDLYNFVFETLPNHKSRTGSVRPFSAPWKPLYTAHRKQVLVVRFSGSSSENGLNIEL